MDSEASKPIPVPLTFPQRERYTSARGLSTSAVEDDEEYNDLVEYYKSKAAKNDAEADQVLKTLDRFEKAQADWDSKKKVYADLVKATKDGGSIDSKELQIALEDYNNATREYSRAVHDLNTQSSPLFSLMVARRVESGPYAPASTYDAMMGVGGSTADPRTVLEALKDAGGDTGSDYERVLMRLWDIIHGKGDTDAKDKGVAEVTSQLWSMINDDDEEGRRLIADVNLGNRITNGKLLRRNRSYGYNGSILGESATNLHIDGGLTTRRVTQPLVEYGDVDPEMDKWLHDRTVIATNRAEYDNALMGARDKNWDENKQKEFDEKFVQAHGEYSGPDANRVSMVYPISQSTDPLIRTYSRYAPLVGIDYFNGNMIKDESDVKSYYGTDDIISIRDSWKSGQVDIPQGNASTFGQRGVGEEVPLPVNNIPSTNDDDPYNFYDEEDDE